MTAPSTTWTRQGSIVFIEREGALPSITGYDFASSPSDEEGLANACVVHGSTALLAAAQAYVTHIEAAGVPEDEQPFVDAFKGAIDKANGVEPPPDEQAVEQAGDAIDEATEGKL